LHTMLVTTKVSLEMEFMVHINNTFPTHSDADLYAKLASQESDRAEELAAQGVIRKVWRRAGQRANVGIWETQDATILHAALASLPFFPWLEIEVWPLANHPNDPQRNRGNQ